MTAKRKPDPKPGDILRYRSRPRHRGEILCHNHVLHLEGTLNGVNGLPLFRLQARWWMEALPVRLATRSWPSLRHRHACRISAQADRGGQAHDDVVAIRCPARLKASRPEHGGGSKSRCQDKV